MRYKWQLYVVLFLCLLGIVWSNEGKEDRYFTNSWVLEINGGDEVADRIAKQHDFINMGQVGSLSGMYHFIHSQSPSRSTRSLDTKYTDLINEHEVTFVEQQVELKRVKRDHIIPHDPQWSQQWYLHRDNKDMNVQPAWDQGVTGKGVVVTILDDGLEHSHPDLRDNYDPNASYDFNSHDSDPTPRYDPTNENNHGTRCAGEVAAGLNDICVVGVAYNASIGGVRMLDGSVTDIVEASSLSFNPQHIDIYSSSWGPIDNGQTVDGPGKLAKLAFINGVTKGRGGKGSIFVWASGNGGNYKDSCNCDGYAVSPYTVSISSVSENELFPWYAEECSSNLAATYSSGSSGEKQIVTTDLHHKCTNRHTGTSAAAPLATGMLALALEVRSNLTWRDIQYIVVYSSNASIPNDGNWITNGVGLKVSLRYGFGVLDGAALVNRARHWINVPQQFNCSIIVNLSGNKKASHSSPLELTLNITKQDCSSINYLEHVQAITTLSVNSGKRGGLHISLQSPQGTVSTLLKPRQHDYHTVGFKKWPFMTVMSWGESPHGQWVFTVSTDSGTSGSLHDLTLVLYGIESELGSVKNISKTCSPECTQCDSELNCLQCNDGSFLYSKHVGHSLMNKTFCVHSCPSGYYGNNISRICTKCSSICATCTDFNFCTSCVQTGVHSDNGVCPQPCASHQFYNSLTKGCESCPVNCTSCINSTVCIFCSQNYFLDLFGQCLSQCQNNSVQNPVTGCKLKCPNNYHDIDGICKPISTNLLLHSSVNISIKARTVYIALSSCVIIIGLVSVIVIIFLCKRYNLITALKKSRNQHVRLYTHPEEFDLNSDSETDTRM